MKRITKKQWKEYGMITVATAIVAASVFFPMGVDLAVLRQSLSELPEREREIVLLRFGLYGRKEMTQKEIAQQMGISQSYISRLEKRIMLRLKKEFLRQTTCA